MSEGYYALEYTVCRRDGRTSSREWEEEEKIDAESDGKAVELAVTQVKELATDQENSNFRLRFIRPIAKFNTDICDAPSVSVEVRAH